MKLIRNYLDRLHPLFAEGGRYERFYPLYEALDTFLYNPPDVTRGPSHVRDAMDLKRMMGMVVVALGPCILMAMYNAGLQANLAIAQLVEAGALATPHVPGWRGAILEMFGVGYDPGSILACFVHGALYFIPIYIVTQIAGGACEVVAAIVRGHEVNEGFLVTGILYPLTLPPDLPLWQVALGIMFGIIIGKEVFGGTGKNFLNPALVARAFVFFAFPAQMSGDRVWVAVDGFTAATPLGRLANPANRDGMKAITEGLVNGLPAMPPISWSDAFWGFLPGSLGETSTFACLLGAVLLVLTGIGSWRIMLSMLAAGMGTAALFNLAASQSENPMFLMSPLWHLVVGGFAFGLVFMATDPVSASMTELGKWIYGALIGVVTMLVRVINPGYPEGVMLAILLGNCFAPLIDYFVLQANIKRRLARSAVRT